MNTPVDLPLRVKVVRDLGADPIAQGCLVGFYALEMAKALDWTPEHRFMQIRQAQLMIGYGHSRLYVAGFEPGHHVALMLTTRTSKREIRRLDALWVAEPYRRRGIGRRLMEEARRGGSDFHSFATPGAVEWHLANGFRSLGSKPEGTVEMFTGSYAPDYSYDFALPTPTEEDMRAMVQLARMEKELGAG